jgi:hypothetical protein
MLKRVLVSLLYVLPVTAMLYFLMPITFSFTVPIPETLPYEYEAIGGTVRMRESYGDMVEFEFFRYSNLLYYIFPVFMIGSALISWFQPNKQLSTPHPIAQQNSIESIKNHPYYKEFIDGDSERLHIYKDELPEVFAAWLVQHTSK